MKRFLLLAAGVAAIGCGARGAGPEPPLRPEPPPPAELSVAQRGNQAILRFEPIEAVVEVDGEAVPIDRVELLVRTERYPVFLPESLASALESERRERMSLAREAAERAERTLARQRAAEEEDPELPEEETEETAEEAEEETGPTPEELLLRRIPFDVRERWREEGIRGEVLLESAERFERALDALWMELELPGAIVDIRQPPELPDPVEIIAAAERVSERLTYEGAQAAPEFLNEAAVVAAVAAEELQEYVVDDLVQFVHTTSPPTSAEIRTRYFFAVRAISAQGEEGRLSQVVSLAPATVPAPPRALDTELGEDGVQLRWEAPLADVTGSEIDAARVGFNVYRRRAAVDVFPEDPLNDEPLRELEYLDEDTLWNTASVYEVRALRVEPEEEETDSEEGTPIGPSGALASSDGPRKESAGAATAEIVATDLFPPNPATVIEAARAGRTVTVRWRASGSDDLDGYRVYRHPAPMPELPTAEPAEEETGETDAEEAAEAAESSAEEGTESAEQADEQEAAEEDDPQRRRPVRRNLLVAAGWEMLTAVPISETRFIDPTSDPSVTWFYLVEAVDESGNVSPPIVVEVAAREQREQR